MHVEEFWSLIDKSRTAADGDPYEQIGSLADLLAAMDPVQVISFDQHFTELHARADQWGLWGAAYIIGARGRRLGMKSVKRFLAILLLALVNGCAAWCYNVDFVGIRVGDTFMLAGEAAVYECAPRVSVGDFLRSKPDPKRCLKLHSEINQHNKVLELVAAGSVVKVSKIKYVDSKDAEFHLVYLRLAGVAGELVVYETDLQELLRVP